MNRPEMHTIVMRGAAGVVRTEMRDGREHAVVPVVMLVEGVIHALGAASPEFVPLATIKRAAESWNGRPVTLGHPTRDGRPCSANDPVTHEAFCIGTVYDARLVGSKLVAEAWIDKVKLKELDPDMLTRLLKNETAEVSVGAMVVADGKPGSFGDKTYKGTWLEATGDHLAFLPLGKTGACSVEMGCGTHRAANLVTAEGIQTVDEVVTRVSTLTSLDGESLSARVSAVMGAIQEQWNAPAMPDPRPYAYVVEVFDDRVIIEVGGTYYSVDYAVDADGAVTFGDSTEVKQAYVAATRPKTKKLDCEACKGAGNVGGNPCEACDGTGEVLRAAAGARHSKSDMSLIQAMHDNATKLGAECDRGNYKALVSLDAKPQSQPQPERVKHEGGSWVLYSRDGKRRLGQHKSRADALAQQTEIDNRVVAAGARR